MKISKEIKRIFFFIIILFLLSITGLFVINYCFSLDKDSFGREIGITILQVIAVGIFGTIFSMLLEQFKHNQKLVNQEQENIRTKNDNRSKFLSENILRQLNVIYSDTKKTRRMLRAKALHPETDSAFETNQLILLKDYDFYLEIINDLQLKLEAILFEIKTNETFIPSASEIQRCIKIMEEYLGEIVKEFETSRVKFTGGPPSLSLKELSALNKMLDHAGSGSQFKTQYIINYKKAISLISYDLLNLTS